MNSPYLVRLNLAEYRFEIVVENDTAVAEYVLSDGHIRFTHTRVPPALKGRGIASELVKAGLKTAGENGWAVTPQCEFFAAYMRKHPETRGLLSDEGREILDEAIVP